MASHQLYERGQQAECDRTMMRGRSDNGGGLSKARTVPCRSGATGQRFMFVRGMLGRSACRPFSTRRHCPPRLLRQSRREEASRRSELLVEGYFPPFPLLSRLPSGSSIPESHWETRTHGPCMIPRSDKIFPTATQANRANRVVGIEPPHDPDPATCVFCPSHYRPSNLGEK